MGSGAAQGHQAATFRPYVAFDFDGTLIWRDSFPVFLAWRAGPVRCGLGAVRLAPAALAYAITHDREHLKQAMVGEFLAGATRDDLCDQADRFAAQRSRRLLRPDAIRCWKRWQAQGARLIIVTASPEFLVAPFARGLGADTLIATRIAFDSSDRATGKLEGPNCRGQEKVVRIKALLGEDVRLDAAYGDSDGDTQMLQLADQPCMKVFGERP